MAIAREVWTYICACFWTAAGLRQRAIAVGGLIATLLAAPLILAAGGTLELTPLGIWWGAISLTVWSALLLFVVAPFFLWREGRKARSQRISRIVAFADEGQAIRDRFRRDRAAPINIEGPAWIAAVNEYLHKHVGDAYAVQFHNAEGRGLYLANRSPAGSVIHDEIGGKLSALTFIVTEIRQKP